MVKEGNTVQMTDYGGRGSAAYDLDKFHPHTTRQKKPKLTVARTAPKQMLRERARARMMAVMRIATVVIAVVGVVVAMLYNRAVLTELNEKINVANALLNEEVTETTRLATEVESKLSLRNVEEYATQKLGMTPMDKSQVVYVNLSEGDKIELTKTSPKRSLSDYLFMSMRRVQEYIGES